MDMTADAPGRSQHDSGHALDRPGAGRPARRARRRVGRPPLTDRAALLAAARDIGFVGLTVGAVTARVGVKYSTFYRHFPNLGALTAALADDVLAELRLPDPDTPWQTYLTDTATVLVELLARHPGLATAAVGLPELPARVIVAHRCMTDVLLSAGFTPTQAALAASTVLHTAATPWLITPPGGATAADRARQFATSTEPLDPRVRAATTALITDARTWIRCTIDQLVRGLEHILDSVPSAAPGDQSSSRPTTPPGLE